MTDSTPLPAFHWADACGGLFSGVCQMSAKEKPSNRLEAVCVVRSGDMLCKSFALDIVDGVVVNAKELTRAEDLPSIAIGHAQRLLWTQYRKNREIPGGQK